MRLLGALQRYGLKWENYLLLGRTLSAARQVRHLVRDQSPTPPISTILPIINDFYLAPQTAWHISDAEKIAWFANFITKFPVAWGRCVHRSLIVYKLLNGYGIPARLIIGIVPGREDLAGHVWVSRIGDGNQAFAEAEEPTKKYLPVFSSALPKS